MGGNLEDTMSVNNIVASKQTDNKDTLIEKVKADDICMCIINQK